MKPRLVPPSFAESIDRRRWLELVGLGAAGAAFSCGDNNQDLGSEGSAIFEPAPDALLVGVWSRVAHAATVEVRDDSGLIGSATMDLAPDVGTGIDVQALQPDRVYHITVTGELSRTYTARTAPAPDATRPVRLAVSADFDPSPEFDSALCDRMIDAAPELFVTIGDFPYTDNGPPANTVPEYRSRHADLRTATRMRPVLEAMPLKAIYDDHEFRNNWDAMFVATEPDRYAAAMQVWDEFFPLRDAPAQIRYRNWRWGANVECILLDCRRFRSADAAVDDATKTMLGATQKAWLLSTLAASTATFKIVFTSVPLDYGTGNDMWTSFATERDDIFDAIATAGTSGVLFVSGDQHWFAAQRHAYGIREFQIGPIARGLGMPPPAVDGVLFRSAQYNVGIIDVDGDELTFAGLGADGTRFYEETLTAAQLTPKK
jgi:alkaline phosphatase D